MRKLSRDHEKTTFVKSRKLSRDHEKTTRYVEITRKLSRDHEKTRKKKIIIMYGRLELP